MIRSLLLGLKFVGMSAIKGQRTRTIPLDEKIRIVRMAENFNGSIDLTQQQLKSEGKEVAYNTIKKYFMKYADRRFFDKNGNIALVTKLAVTRPHNDITRKKAVKVYESCKFDWTKTKEVLKRTMDINIEEEMMVKWYGLYGREVVENKRFKDTVNKLSSTMAVEYKKAGEMVSQLSFDVKRAALERLLILIPSEKDVYKLANVVKIIQDADEPTENNTKVMLQQFNNYFPQNETKENRDQGDIQDVTPVD